MKTRQEQMTGGGLDGYHNFLGDDSDYRDWFGILGQSRDSEALERSNFRVGLEMLGGESDDVRVEHYGHWAVGWIEEIYVRPGSPAHNIAIEIEAQLSDYPVLGEDDFYMEESDEADEVWRLCFDVAERIGYIRDHRNQFYFDSLADMIGCVRGNYFAGDACDLLN